MFRRLSRFWGDPAGEPQFQASWRPLLRQGVWHYQHLPQPYRERLHRIVADLVHRVRWTGGAGFVVTEEMKVVVAGATALLAVGHDEPYRFSKLQVVILYPTTYRPPEPEESKSLFGFNPVVGMGPRLGEAWRGGPVVLSWRAAQRQARVRGRGANVILHEMAHHLDGLDGDADGDPYFADEALRRRWRTVAPSEYHRLVGQAGRGEPTLLDPYGATSEAEFFAVSTECFFERPHAMRERHAELFELLTSFYAQDPTTWAPPRDASPDASPVRQKRQPSWKQYAEQADFSHLGIEGADALFSRGVLMMDAEQFEQAARLFGEAIEQEPDDAEAYQQRAIARLQLGDDRGALADAENALQGEPDDVDAMCVAAEASLALGADHEAEEYVRAALREESGSLWALILRGRLDLRHGEPKKAMRSFRRVLAADRYNAKSHYRMAQCLDELGQSEHAERRRRRAFELDPGLEQDPPPL
ncbi:MAG: zinc-dependent peptidase [Planctomycetota bacterium]